MRGFRGVRGAPSLVNRARVINGKEDVEMELEDQFDGWCDLVVDMMR